MLSTPPAIQQYAGIVCLPSIDPFNFRCCAQLMYTHRHVILTCMGPFPSSTRPVLLSGYCCTGRRSGIQTEPKIPHGAPWNNFQCSIIVSTEKKAQVTPKWVYAGVALERCPNYLGAFLESSRVFDLAPWPLPSTASTHYQKSV